MLGHKDASMTLSKYARYIKRDKKNKVVRMTRRIQRKNGGR